ncbi:hypothetical protein SPI_00784 [Niveomyces insectorum RCEF 264]|uniref:Signal peptide-containing protein n=1 Tax=Niveomyces insectorum RCEF 264 TaxID=1081102 RepID=A0A162MQN4_9HYPO|nr:hypothetical protein SPI_00784 [Niveomyces insectorum RCEF 264]
MSFPVAVQSAIFYFLACTPCMSARNRYRAREQFRRDRKERSEIEEEDPPLYRHPSPFNVNPYWQEEIMMGPSLPKKGRGNAHKPSSQRKLTSAGKDSSIATRSSLVVSSHGAPSVGVAGPRGNVRAGTKAAGHELETGAGAAAETGAGTGADVVAADGATGSGNDSGAGADVTVPPPTSPTLAAIDSHSMSMVEPTTTATTLDIEGWNHKRYQREDEELWGNEPSRTHKLMDAIVKAGSSAGRLLESTLGKERNITDEDRANFYAPTIIHPPVNEYHPPVVSNKPANKDALRWMLQPPPPAKVMEGKVPVSRSTSVASSIAGGGGGGRRSAPAGSEASLTRRMALEARLRRVDSSKSAITAPSGVKTASSAEETGPSDAGDSRVAAGKNSARRRAPKKLAASGDVRPKSQRRTIVQGQTRSRSGSLTSSAEDLGWSSDEEGSLKARWQFPLSAVAASNSNRTQTAHQQQFLGKQPLAEREVPSLNASESRLSGSGTGNESGTGSGSRTPTAATSAQQPAHGWSKLETILSSDSSVKADVGPSDEKDKENTPIAVLEGQDRAAEAASGNDNETKTQQFRSTSSSIDSGLALST